MKRDSRITADITEASHELLREAVIKFDSSKGKLLEKMIKNFLGVKEEAEKSTEIAVSKKAPVKRFVPPTVMEVWGYMIERGCAADTECTEAHKFCDHFESNGWKVGGKTKMVSWKASVRNFLKGSNNGNKANKNTGKKLSAYERARAANAEYRQSDELEVGVGADVRHMGRAVDERKGRATLTQVDNGTFTDYEQ